MLIMQSPHGVRVAVRWLSTSLSHRLIAGNLRISQSGIGTQA